MKFLHTADWQIGKPFARMDDPEKAGIVRQERLQAIGRIGTAARNFGAQAIVVAGDLFDSGTPSKATVSATCSAIGALGLPVFVIPGNHDHGGAGSIWEQEFFLREAAGLAKNLRILLTCEPVECEGAVLFPCPLTRRHDLNDPTAWLRTFDFSPYGHKPRIVLAHGSTQEFSAQDRPEDDEGTESSANLIALDRLPLAELDFIALGDWHGMKQVHAKAWYSGTPEPDRFPRGGDYAPGFALGITVERGVAPVVEPLPISRLAWHRLSHHFTDDASLGQLEEKMDALVGARTGSDLVRLEIEGSLGMEAHTRLDSLLETWRARLLRLRLHSRLSVAPTTEEIHALTQRPSDPLITRVAALLIEKIDAEPDQADAARLALRELHARLAACQQ